MASPRLLHRQLLPIPPLLPRAGVVADVGVAEEAQRDVGVGGAVAALAVGDDFLVGRDAGRLVPRTELVGRFELAVGGEVARPLDVNRTRDGAAAPGADGGAAVLPVGPCVDDRGAGIAETRLDVAPRCERAGLRRAGPRAR